MSEAVFMSAVRHLQTLDTQLQPELRNRLYGLYKQATEGDCSQDAPGRGDPALRAKWEAWKSLRGMSRHEAMENYIEDVKKVDRNWRPQAVSVVTSIAGPGRKQGVLYKQRDVFKGWRPRVFVLNEEMACLHYYLEEDDIQGGQPRKSILLTGSIVTPVKPTKNQDREFFPFVLSHPHSSKTYNLASTTQEDAEGWIRALREAAARAPATVVDTKPDPTERILARHVPKDTAAIEAKADDVDQQGRARIPPEFVTKVETAVETLLETGNTLDDWRPTFEKNGVQAYSRPGTLVCVRGDGEIDHPVADVFRTVVDLERKKEWDSQLASARRVRKFSSNTWVDHLKFKQVWPTAARDLVNLCHWRLLEDGTVVIVAFSQKFDDIAPREDGVVRAECIIAGYIIRPIKSGKAVRMTYLVQTDLKGTIPTTVVNMVAEGQPMLVAALRKLMDADAQNQSRPRLLLPTRRTLTTGDLEYIFENYNDPTKFSTGPAASAGSESKSAAPAPAAASSPRNTAAAAGRPESVRVPPGQSAKAAVADEAAADPTAQAPRDIGVANLLVLFLPVVLYFLPNPKYRGLAFVAGLMFALRYLFKLHLGSPRSDTGVLATEQITDGRMLVRFNIEVGRLLRYLDEKRKTSDVDISLTHVAVKSAGLALHECSQLNGRVVLGGFYPCNDIDVSVSFNNSEGENAVVKIEQAHRKPVDYIADEVQKLTKALSDPNNKEVLRMKAVRKLFRSMPPAIGAYCERVLHFLGGHLGISIPALGVQPFPLGSCTIVTAPPPSTENTASLDVDMTVIPTKYNAATPITLTIGGIHVAPKVDSDNRMVPTHVQSMTLTIDCRAATLPQGRQFAEKVQEFLTNPQLLDKFDRQEMNAIERKLNSRKK